MIFNMKTRSKNLVLAALSVSNFSLLHILYEYNNICHQLIVIIKCFVIVSNYYCTCTIWHNKYNFLFYIISISLPKTNNLWVGTQQTTYYFILKLILLFYIVTMVKDFNLFESINYKKMIIS